MKTWYGAAFVGLSALAGTLIGKLSDDTTPVPTDGGFDIKLGKAIGFAAGDIGAGIVSGAIALSSKKYQKAGFAGVVTSVGLLAAMHAADRITGGKEFGS